jgi:hypothetical protein
MAFNYSPKSVKQGLVLHLDGANKKSYSGTGTSWIDLSVNKNNGVLTNGPTYNASYAGGIVLDGTNDHVVITDSTSLRPSTQLTMEAAFRMTTKNIYNTIFCKPATNAPWSSPFLSYMLRVQSLSLQIGLNIDSTYVALDHTYNYLINTNYHVLFNIDITTGAYKYFLNGDLVLNTTTTSGTAITYGTQPTLVGAGYGSSPIGEVFTGTVFFVRLYNRVLSDSEAKQNYYAHKSRFNLI